MKKVTFALAAALTFGGIGTVATTASAESNGLDKDCSDFKGKPYQEVVDYWNSKGYTATNDPERLDGWGNKVDDGIPCEAPSDYDTSKINGIGKKEEATSEETTKEETTTEQSTEEQPAKEDNSSSEQKATSDKKEGEELPETASNNPLGVAAGLAVAAAGVVVFTRRKNSKA
ncbi:LPXTG cell wall anchor domain-containing protein [Priestia megaterium]|jgi:LPXTG-motif cell wall-anchored protein|uniref:LPXTG cell wall anchor domain-containing protein n=1 Tax=Priestia megaterium TaxID=1404 RepID=UPI0013E351E5|nr:LPXTG cell wall anchor domain-containing protein [Priestia megaterium]MDI3093508.1 LPXTG cell wall anchor domain-containing protein [Priestia megaterium]MED3863225.1 LPXTG cell wall anchor domain-containing protein [Priestia megaterium]MED4101823.1 LPXTG cell wall anchor domain-containing protein [Priestia megaterium]MED4142078.1 LPXTG cell wall anchor domain-containing protein [Priestia megaterium]MED4166566.1 LPXTG cell wall anchor domain-containing protein [Priestia megaterium]